MYESIVLNLFGRLAIACAVSEFFFSNDSPHTVCSDSSFKLQKSHNPVNYHNLKIFINKNFNR